MLDGWALVGVDAEVSLGSRMGLGGVDLTRMAGSVFAWISVGWIVVGWMGCGGWGWSGLGWGWVELT